MEHLEDEADGVRVTRSLRKRLVSGDSDAPTRSDTPVMSKLSSVSEAGTPTNKLRTRRSSVSTPVPPQVKTITQIRSETPEIKSPRRRSTRKRSISITDDDSITMPTATPKLALNLKFDALTEEDPEVMVLDISEDNDTTSSKNKIPPSTPIKTIEPEERHEKVEKSVEMKEKNVKDKNEGSIQPEDAESQEEIPLKQLRPLVVITEVINLNNITAEKMADLIGPKLTDAPNNEHLPENSKSVTFVNSDMVDSAKKIYQKTPGHTKTKSCIEMDLSKENINTSFQSNNKGVMANLENAKSSEDRSAEEIVCSPDLTHNPIDDLEPLIMEESSPNKSKLLKTRYSSTPIATSEPTKLTQESKQYPMEVDLNGTCVEMENMDDSSTRSLRSGKKYSPTLVPIKKSTRAVDKLENKDDDTLEKTNDAGPFPRLWSQGVSGKSTISSKIDTIEMDISAPDNQEEFIAISKSVKKKSPFTQRLPLDSEDDEELDEYEKAYTESPFLDNEAMEVNDDYRSGDSMTEEERREIEENEAVEKGESLGSVDTEVDDSREEDGSEYDASFIASSGEEFLDVTETSDHKKNKYKRLHINSSEDTGDEEEESKNNDSWNIVEQNESADKSNETNISEEGDQEEEKSEDESTTKSERKSLKTPNKQLNNNVEEEDELAEYLGAELNVSQKATSKVAERVRQNIDKSNKKSNSPMKSKLESEQSDQKIQSSSEKCKTPIEAVGKVSKPNKPNKFRSVAIDTTSSSEEEEGCPKSRRPIDLCQSLALQRAEVYESSDDSILNDSEANKFGKYRYKTDPATNSTTSDSESESENEIKLDKEKAESKQTTKRVESSQPEQKDLKSLNKSRKSFPAKSEKSIKLLNKSDPVIKTLSKDSDSETESDNDKNNEKSQSKEVARAKREESQSQQNELKSLPKSRNSSITEKAEKSLNKSVPVIKAPAQDSELDSDLEPEPELEINEGGKSKLREKSTTTFTKKPEKLEKSLNKSEPVINTPAHDSDSESESELEINEEKSKLRVKSTKSFTKKAEKLVKSLNKSEPVINTPASDSESESELEKNEEKSKLREKSTKSFTKKAEKLAKSLNKSQPVIKSPAQDSDSDSESESELEMKINKEKSKLEEARAMREKSTQSFTKKAEKLAKSLNRSEPVIKTLTKDSDSDSESELEMKRNKEKSKLEEARAMREKSTKSSTKKAEKLAKSLNKSEPVIKTITKDSDSDPEAEITTAEQKGTDSTIVSRVAFTVGVTTIRTERTYSEPQEPDDSDSENELNEKSSTSKSQFTAAPKETDQQLSSEDEKQLEKLTHVQKLTHSLTKRQRQSLALPDAHIKSSTAKPLKRLTVGVCEPSEESAPPVSSVEKVEDDEVPKKSMKRKRSSISLSSQDMPESDGNERHLSKKLKILKEQDADLAKEPGSKKPQGMTKMEIDIILNRCNEILNEAKSSQLESKSIIHNKNKGKIQKRSKKQKEEEEDENEKEEEEEDKGEEEEEEDKGEEEGDEEPMVISKNYAETSTPFPSKKELKRREKTKLAVEQALKASADIILNVPGKKRNKLPKIEEAKVESKRLPVEILEAITDTHAAIKYKTKDYQEDVGQESSEPADAAEPVPKKKKKKLRVVDEKKKAGALRKLHTLSGDVVEDFATPMKKKKTRKIELSTGTVFVEPLSPKSSATNGFHESPITPRTTSFKVRKLLTGSSDIPPTQTPKSLQKRKRKRQIEEPKTILPDPLWTSTGFFVEDTMPLGATPLARSGATEFFLAVNKGHKTKKASAKHIPSPVSSVPSFKKDAMSREGIQRTKSHTLLQQKERRRVHQKF